MRIFGKRQRLMADLGWDSLPGGETLSADSVELEFGSDYVACTDNRRGDSRR
jgi:hypothetical protein